MGGYENKRPILASQANQPTMTHSENLYKPPIKQIRTINKPKSATGYRINQSKSIFAQVL